MNITHFIKTIKTGEGVSKRTSNPYQYIDIVFQGKYTLRKFLTQEEVYVIEQIAKSPSDNIEISDNEDLDNFLDD